MTMNGLVLVEVPELSQLRSVKALDRILAAGEKLLAVNAFEDASVSEISKLADSSVGSFYRIVGDKETLSLLLIQRFFNSIIKEAEALPQKYSETHSLSDFTFIVVDTFMNQIYSGRRGVLRAVILRASRDAEFRDKVHELNDLISTAVVSASLPFLNEVRHPDPRMAIATGTHMVLGVLNQHTVSGSLGGLPTSQIVCETNRLFLAYLSFSG